MDIRQATDNSIVILFARIILPVLLTIGTPVAGWLLLRAVNTVDAQSAKLDDHTQRLTEIRIEAKTARKLAETNDQRTTGILADHESRIRILEHIPFSVAPPHPH